MEQQIPIYFIIAKPRPKHNAAVRGIPGGCVPFIRSMLVSLLPLQLRQLRFHLCDQHLQLLLTFLLGGGVDVPSHALLAWISNRWISSGVRTFIYLGLADGSLHPSERFRKISFSSTALSSAAWRMVWMPRTVWSNSPSP